MTLCLPSNFGCPPKNKVMPNVWMLYIEPSARAFLILLSSSSFTWSSWRTSYAWQSILASNLFWAIGKWYGHFLERRQHVCSCFRINPYSRLPSTNMRAEEIYIAISPLLVLWFEFDFYSGIIRIIKKEHRLFSFYPPLLGSFNITLEKMG